MEVDEIRKHLMPLCNLRLWNHLHKRRRDLELSRNIRLKVTWEMHEIKRYLFGIADQLDEHNLTTQSNAVDNFLEIFDDAMQDDPMDAIRSGHTLINSLRSELASKGIELTPSPMEPQSYFFPYLVNILLQLLRSADYDDITCRIVEFFTELLSQLTTRRYLLAYLTDRHVLPHLRLSGRCEENNLLRRLTDRLAYFLSFAVDEMSGEELSDEEASERYYKKILVFQNVVFKYVLSSITIIG